MTDPKKQQQQQPKVLQHKPKKSQRVATGVSTANEKGSNDGKGGSKAVSTNSSSSSGLKEPVWYRFRTAFTTLLVVNAILVGYTIFRTSFKPTLPEKLETSENGGKEREKSKGRDEENAQVVNKDEALSSSEIEEALPSATRIMTEQAEVTSTPQYPAVGQPKLSVDEALPSASVVAEQAEVKPMVRVGQPKLSVEEQQKLFQWLLSEKRKVKTRTRDERALIDAEKALLKEFLRSKKSLDF
ncbi:hypothetical protein KP509_16G063800 [Ceratopteris richardii]|uniref:Transmembrane protein n=2 Tax=Ceratopteris richardii TaxID=49495 RepID=A0A8T2T3W6_CERRI|nr:hypothetical protein KP509_16G063800 [Ceratopteris richardii]